MENEMETDANANTTTSMAVIDDSQNSSTIQDPNESTFFTAKEEKSEITLEDAFLDQIPETEIVAEQGSADGNYLDESKQCADEHLSQETNSNGMEQEDMNQESSVNKLEEKAAELDSNQPKETQQEHAEKESSSSQIKTKPEDDGELASDHEEAKERKPAERSRKRSREKTLEQQYMEEPKAKKAALEQLKNMKFATKDPFLENPARDRPTLVSRTREKSPPRKVSSEEHRSRRRDEASSSSRKRRSRSGGRRARGAESSASLIESRHHQRSTMFFLQNEQRAAMAQQREAVPTKPLRDRIEAILAKPDGEVLALPAADIKALILRGAELFREQQHLLTGRQAQLIELNAMIAKQQEDIMRISQELPSEYRPPLIEELLSSRKQQQEPIQYNQQKQFEQPAVQKAVPNFSVPPPNMTNDFSTATQPQLQQSQSVGMVSVPASVSFTSAGGISHFGQTPSLLFSKPSSSMPSTGPINSLSVPPPNISIPPPNISLSNELKQQQTLNQNAPQLPTFTVPPPSINVQQTRPKQELQPVQQSQPAILPSLMSHPPPAILVSSSASFSQTSTTSMVASPLKPNFSMPPPAVPPEILSTKPSPLLSLVSKEFVQPPPMVQQLATPVSAMPHLTPPSLTPSIGSSTSAAGPSPKPPPRPLMSINFGYPTQLRQTSPSRMAHQQQQQMRNPQYSQSNETSAELTKAVGSGGRPRGRRLPLRSQQRLGRGRGGRTAQVGRRGSSGGGKARKRFSSSPSPRVAPDSENAEAEEQNGAKPTCSARSSPLLAVGGEQADSSTVEFEDIQPDQQSANEAEPICDLPPQNAPVETDASIVQAADTTITSTDEMLPVSP